MSLSTKIGILIASLFALSVGASIAVDRWVFLPSFHELERVEARRNTGRAVEALHHELHVLATHAAAWGWRDELGLLLDGGDAQVFQQLVDANSFAREELDFIGLYGEDSRQVARQHFESEATRSGLGRFESDSLPLRHPLLQGALAEGQASGLVSTPSGAMLAAARRVGDPESDDPNGVLIFGRVLDAGSVARIADRYKLDMEVVPAASAPIFEAAAGPPEDWAPDQPRRATWVREDETGQRLQGHTLIADLHGDPLIAVIVYTERSISARGEKASRFAVATLCSVGVAALLLLLGLLHRTVLAPIARLTEHALEIGRDTEATRRLELARPDEIGVLANEFERMTERLAETRQRLVDQSFVSGKADMAAGILHNLGNAVTPIAVRLDTALDRIKAASTVDLERALQELDDDATSPDRRRDLMRFVELVGHELGELLASLTEDLSATSRATNHVQQILAEQECYSRAGAQAPRQSLDLIEIIRSAADQLPPSMLRSIEVTLEDSLARLRVRAPRVQLQQVLGNLILNAAESIKEQRPGGGCMAITASCEPCDDGPMVHLCIADNGAGIESDVLPKLFERQFSTKGRGSGLGLHWSATAVGTFGGRLKAESAGRGLGAIFHLWLPRADTPAAEENTIGRKDVA